MTRNEIESLLQCKIECASINFEQKVVVLELPRLNCVDMQGAIAFAQTLFPDVEHIKTFSGGYEDTEYIKKESGWDWKYHHEEMKQ